MIIVGGKNTIRRGIYQHIFFNRLLDDITRKERMEIMIQIDLDLN